jgi:hypothetical protein
MTNIKEKKQTKVIKSQLVKAERITTGIRNVFDLKTYIKWDKATKTRLSSAVLKWLEAPDPHEYSPALDKFSFTESPFDFHSIWKVPMQLFDLFNGYTSVKIPALVTLEKIVAPPGTSNILCFLDLGVLDILTGEKICSSNHPIVYRFTSRQYEERIFNLKSIKTRGNLMVAAITLVFMGNEKKRGTYEIGYASGIVAARYRS